MPLSAISITRPLVFVEVEVSGDCLVVAVAHSVLTILLSLEYWNLKGIYNNKETPAQLMEEDPRDIFR